MFRLGKGGMVGEEVRVRFYIVFFPFSPGEVRITRFD